MRNAKCCECDKMAVWINMAASREENLFYCDDHVPRGCTCNLCDIDFDGIPEKDENLLWWTKEDYEKNFRNCTTEKEIEELATTKRQVNSFFYEYLDEKGRRYPCCEYEYDEDGFDLDN